MFGVFGFFLDFRGFEGFYWSQMVGNQFVDLGKAGQTRISWILVQNPRFSDFWIFLDFWDPETPDSFRRFGSHVAALGELQPVKCSY